MKLKENHDVPGIILPRGSQPDLVKILRRHSGSRNVTVNSKNSAFHDLEIFINYFEVGENFQ